MLSGGIVQKPNLSVVRDASLPVRTLAETFPGGVKGFQDFLHTNNVSLSRLSQALVKELRQLTGLDPASTLNRMSRIHKNSAPVIYPEKVRNQVAALRAFEIVGGKELAGKAFAEWFKKDIFPNIKPEGWA